MKKKIDLLGAINLPKGIKVYKHNSCADICKYRNRFYLAFRTAPFHFPHPGALMHIISSKDAISWEIEKTIRMNRDIREPRFLIIKGKIFLYFFAGSKVPLTFRRLGIYMVSKTDNWKEIISIFPKGYIHWRVRKHKGLAYMSLCRPRKKQKGNIYIATSSDGLNWNFIWDKPLNVGSGSAFESNEFEFEFDSKGNIIGIIRSEIHGSKIIFIPDMDTSKMKIIDNMFRYDSALLLKENKKLYLFARKNLDGPVDKSKKILRSQYNLIKYWLTKKRTSIFEFDPDALKIKFLQDIPSKGDTAFPALCKIGKGAYLLVNYSSPLEGKEKNWLNGQLGKTCLYLYNIYFSH